MFKIVNNQAQVLELDPSATVTVDKNQPLFSESKELIPDFAAHSTAPFTEPNKIFFKHAQLAETPGSAYTQPATSYCEEAPLSKGNITANIGTNGFEFNLEPDFAAITSLTKGIRLPQIRTDDALTFANAAEFEAMMMDTVVNPDKYPFIFFPVHNPGASDIPAEYKYDFVNYFNPATQQFQARPPAGWDEHLQFDFGQTPFFKLSYILQKLVEYLGYTAEGDVFTDPKLKNICIYTRISSIRYTINPSMRYMPNMLISDFLQQLLDGKHLAVNFDNNRGVATFYTFAGILRNSKKTDITPYIGTVIEQQTPKAKGYAVTLKSDEQDVNFKVVLNGQDTYPPLYRLTAGDGSTGVELDCSTTKGVDLGSPGVIGAKYVSVSQGITSFRFNIMPADINQTDPDDPTTLNNWPLRLVNFTGWTALTGGGHYPCSEPVDLNDDDALYYRFQNDHKKLIIPCWFPPSVLANLNMAERYTYQTAGLNYVDFILEKVSYDIRLNDAIVAAKLYVRTINFDVNTRVSIQPVGPNIPTAPYTFGRMRAYFDNSLNGFDQLNIEVVPTGDGIGHNLYLVTPIINPTNYKGAGGTSSAIIIDPAALGTWDPYLIDFAEVRISQGNPKFMEHLGTRRYFAWSGTYWYVPIHLRTDAIGDMQDDYWISF